MRIGVLISGNGSNLQSLIDARASGSLSAEISIVISNVPDAIGLDRATKANIPISIINHTDFKSREKFESALHAALLDASVDFVCLAGFMRLLTEPFVNKWTNRIVNIHPSMLPAFKGLNTHERVLQAGVRFTGCTIHFVRPEMDEGPIILQAAVPVLPGDGVDSLAARVLEQEHIIYPLAVEMIARDRVKVENGRVLIKEAGTQNASIINPSS